MKNLTLEIDQICEWINHICSPFSGCVLGLSGGLDSAVVAALCVKAGVNLHALIMPARSHNQAFEHANLIANKFNIKTKIIDIKPVIDALMHQINPANSANLTPDSSIGFIRYGNLCARTRMMLLYDYSAEHNLLVVGTSNKSERMLGYFTLWGDMACAFNPIANFYKSEVKELAKALDINERIITKAPSADFYDDQSDEADIGFSYEQIDAVLKAYEAGKQIDQEFNPIIKRVQNNRFKLEKIKCYERSANEQDN